MDAFAVAICKGLSIKKITLKKTVKIGIFFGTFQMLMPVLGYLTGIRFSELVEKVDHWIAFGLLSFIGIKMIKETFYEETLDDRVDLKTMVVLAVATSIDAFAVGITYAFLESKNIFLSFIMIGIITFILSIIGVKIGNKFGTKIR